MQHQFVLVLALLVVVLSLGLVAPGLAYADVNNLRQGHWAGGTGIGFWGNTPDGAAEVALNGHADYFFTPNVSLGPLAQYAGAGNDIIFGLSAQAQYWWGISGRRNLVNSWYRVGSGSSEPVSRTTTAAHRQTRIPRS